MLITGVITFFTTRHNIENKIRDKGDELNKRINELEKELMSLKHRDDLQQQVIDEVKKTVFEYLPKLFNILEKEKSNSK